MASFSLEQSYDATTHFESTVDDVLNMYTLITGKVCFHFGLCLHILEDIELMKELEGTRLVEHSM